MKIKAEIKKVVFFGYAEAKPRSRLYRDAFATAKLLAEHRFTIINGGGPGVMDASTQGAEKAEGETLAITFSPKDAPGFEGIYVSNIEAVDREIKTGNYIERMFKLLEHGDAFVIFQGGTGTLSEFSTAWVLARLYYGHHKPLVLFGEFWQEIVKTLCRHMKIRESARKVFKIVSKPREVFETLVAFEKEISGIDHTRECPVCTGKMPLKYRIHEEKKK